MSSLILKNGTEVLVDEEDLSELRKYGWHLKKDRYTTYVHARIGGKKITLHRFLMRPSAREQVDHIDGNGLNNCRSNLRICSSAENAANRRRRSDNKHTKYKGVVKRRTKDGIKYQALVNKVSYGWYTSEAEAARAYNKAAVEVYGEFAKLNKVIENV